MSTHQPGSINERTVHAQNGWMMLILSVAILFAGFGLLTSSMARNNPPVVLTSLGLMALGIVLLCGLYSLQPNQARVLVLFGAYKGTARESGFHWGNPFYSNAPLSGRSQISDAVARASGASHHSKVEAGSSRPKQLGRNKISLRARTLNGEKLKVNDKRGNPIEIAAVVVWRVQDTAQAVFDVDDYEKYTVTQSESALRHLASRYSYDDGGEDEITLRSNITDVSHALRTELQERIAKAGVAIDEARLTHLAYAPEIAQAMLRRQQAEAVIAAREKIVHGAVSMVHMALTELAEKGVVQLDDERRAAMVSNLMVVLCGESEVHPVVNTGTLYN
jgi:regulator of protease activity HflC (stomatin/prohibitin superfamily)